MEPLFRGELPVKDDVDVTEADRQRANMVLFGDPGSNSILHEVLSALPITWTNGDSKCPESATTPPTTRLY